jgi:hypothetical protein
VLFTRFYYGFKPLLPAALRMKVRRWFALRKRLTHREVWPISESAGKLPPNWPGWPDGKQFALVITHDVEGLKGLNRCRQLMELEIKLGFRSSFNFVPEGDYRVPPELREELTQNGFEVGVHDLNHDGKLYHSRKEFAAKALRINRHLKDWGAAGFRSAFMLHNLDWLHDLNVQYDASTFDTDPFEPQPDGVSTIFPFWVPNPSPNWTSGHASRITHHASGYVELPYTLPQDSTVFLLLKERRPHIWMQKLDWIARHGGMAMLIVHPDYISFANGSPDALTYPEALYKEFLDSVNQRYAGCYWNALPKEIAAFYRNSLESSADPEQAVLAAEATRL